MVQDMLLRPYIVKLGNKAQMSGYEKEHDEAEAQAQAKMSANELRGLVDIPEDSDDEDAVATATGATGGPDWGKKARRRQREMIRNMLEAEERRLQESKEEEEDKDIEEYLVKE